MDLHSHVPDTLKHDLLQVGFTRRGMLRSMVAGSIGLAITPLLAACGSGDDDDDAPADATGDAAGSQASPATGSPASGANDASGEEPKMGGTLRWYLPDDPPDLDPHMQTTSSLQWVSGMCYNGLLRFDVQPGNGPESEAASTPVPDLAEEWEVAEDGLTYTFTLREGVKFHDGTDLTTEDVAFSLNRIRTDAPEFQRSYAFRPVESVVATDARTVTVSLAEPYAAFLNQIAVAYSRIAPQHVIEAEGDMKQTIVGTGPFKLESYQRGQKIVLVRNDDYWEEGLPYLDGVDITIMPDNATQLAAFTAGQIDIYTPLNYAQVDALMGTNPDITVNEWAGTGMNGIGCNIAVAPFDDIRVRQAMFYAIDQQQIIDVVHSGHGFLQRSVPTALAGWVVPYEELPLGDAPDLDKARQLLEEAGYPDGLDVQCKTVVRYTQREATVASEQLREIGINMEIVDTEYGSFLEARNNGDFDVIGFAISPFGDIEDFTTSLYQTESSRNYGGWGNAELDELLARGRAEVDVPARQEIFREVQAVISENCWIVDLARGNELEVWHPHVKDYVSGQNPERGLGFWRVWLDR